MMERRKNLNDKFGFVEIMEVSLNEIGEIITGNTQVKVTLIFGTLLTFVLLSQM